MALKKFIGARYAPQFMGAWNKSTIYAALSVVYTGDRSYVSRKTVPAGTAITNTEFWIQSSDWNAQVAEYNQKVEAYAKQTETYNKNVTSYTEAVNSFYADTLHSFKTKADMQADKTLKLGETLLTCGNKKIGDGGGSFYQVVDATSSTAVALDNGLFAEPFEFQPYDSFHVYTPQSAATTFESAAPIGSINITDAKKNINIDMSNVPENELCVVAVNTTSTVTITFKVGTASTTKVYNSTVGFVTFYYSKQGITNFIAAQEFLKPTSALTALNYPTSASDVTAPYYTENNSIVVNGDTTVNFPVFPNYSTKIVYLKNVSNSSATVTFKFSTNSGTVNVEGGTTCIAVLFKDGTSDINVSKFVSSDTKEDTNVITLTGGSVTETDTSAFYNVTVSPDELMHKTIFFEYGANFTVTKTDYTSINIVLRVPSENYNSIINQAHQFYGSLKLAFIKDSNYIYPSITKVNLAIGIDSSATMAGTPIATAYPSNTGSSAKSQSLFRFSTAKGPNVSGTAQGVAEFFWYS